MTTRALIILVLVLTGAVALAATNPTKDAYGQFIQEQLGRVWDRLEASGTPEQKMMGMLMKTQGRPVIDSLLAANTQQRNYGLFSRFDTRVLGVEISFLGVASSFIPLSDLDAVSQQLSVSGRREGREQP